MHTITVIHLNLPSKKILDPPLMGVTDSRIQRTLLVTGEKWREISSKTVFTMSVKHVNSLTRL